MTFFISRFKPVAPRKLRATEIALERRYGQPGGYEAPDMTTLMLMAANLIDKAMKSNHLPVLSRKEASLILQAYTGFEDEKRKEQAARMLLMCRGVTWRNLWDLWQMTDQYDPELCPRLSKLLMDKRADSKLFRERHFPKWLPTDSRKKLTKTLKNPNTAILDYCQKNDLILTSLPESLGFHQSNFKRVSDALCYAIKKGNRDWWTAVEGPAQREWAQDRTEDILKAVAERQLLEHGENATCPGDINSNHGLSNWILATLKDPALYPNRWRDMNPRAADIFGWLFIRDEFGKIMSQFQSNSSDRDRALFWKNYLSSLRDARYLEVGNVAVCLMVLGGTLIVEFGDTGNALYCYRKPNKPLRVIDVPKNRRASHFKDTRGSSGIKLGAENLGFRRRFSHTLNWQDAVARYLRTIIRAG